VTEDKYLRIQILTNFSLETVANDRSNLLHYFLLVLTTEVYHNVETEHKMLSITNTDFI
jgi:hypothetical protein